MTGESEGSITHWIRELDGGAEQAAQEQLWHRYFKRLAALARKRLASAPRAVEDEEDVVVCAFESFFERAKAGRFPDLKDRNGLWRLLATITARKAMNQVSRQNAKKRQAGPNVVRDVEEIVGQDPTPEFAAQISEELRRLLGMLDEDVLRRLAVLKLEGYTNQEIAENLGVSLSTIARKLTRIRSLWQNEAGNEPKESA